MFADTALERLAAAIDYPAAVAAGAREFVFEVDGLPVRASVAAGRLTLAWTMLTNDGAGADLAALAPFAAGRIAKEEAVLAWDPRARAPVLWQDIASTASAEALRRLFEVFAASCEWWQARLVQSGENARIPEMTILP